MNVFAKKGYFNVSINYRLEPPGCSAGAPTVQCVVAIVEAQQDAQTAVKFLRANAATYDIDVDRIAIGGSSAGAITALNVGFNSNADPMASVGAAVSLSGGYLGTPDAADAPSLLFHGTADSIVPYQWAVDTVTKATAVGLDSFLTSWTGAGHVPYVAHRTEILDQTQNFLYWSFTGVTRPVTRVPQACSLPAVATRPRAPSRRARRRVSSDRRADPDDVELVGDVREHAVHTGDDERGHVRRSIHRARMQVGQRACRDERRVVA